jgi:DNA invertase Pin-like site-specific DNA recombinase
MTTTTAARAALYLRVSTTRQAEADLSLPDQLKQLQAYCERRGWVVVDTFTSQARRPWTMTAPSSRR